MCALEAGDALDGLAVRWRDRDPHPFTLAQLFHTAAVSVQPGLESSIYGATELRQPRRM
jgi:hypothetical protein